MSSAWLIQYSCIVELRCLVIIMQRCNPVFFWASQLSNLMLEWNHHRIRNTVTAEAPGGIPEVLYHLPAVGSSGKVIFSIYAYTCIHMYINPPSHLQDWALQYPIHYSLWVKFIGFGLPSFLLFFYYYYCAIHIFIHCN